MTNEQSPAAGLLSQVERVIGPLFFPMPGPIIAPDRRERDQRSMIEWSGALIDVDEFQRGNAILIRDRSARRGGCMGAVVLLFAGATGAGMVLGLLAFR